MSPAPKINLHSLLNRNVPSIEANLRRLKYQMNLAAANRLLWREQRRTTPKTIRTALSPSPSPINDSEWISLNSLPDCPQVPSGLEGQIVANVNHSDSNGYTEELLERLNPELQPGGKWLPSSCLPRHRVAVVIPYRDRKQHLLVLLAHLHPVLQRQLISYQIFVVEQYGNQTFNKARIMNVAFITAVLNSSTTFDCFVFHDVDLVPEDDRNMYSCPDQPRHMSVAIDEMNYQIPYEELVGGVFAIRTEHFFKVNGYSNLYWGWGAEDDDMAYRIQHVGLRIIRPPSQIARYKMIRHTKRSAVDARIRYRLLWTGVRRHKIDGLNSLDSLNYKIVSTTWHRLYTHLMVDIGPPPPGF